MLKRVDDYVRSEKDFRSTELPKGEFQRKEVPVQWGQRNDLPRRGPFGSARRRPDHKPTFWSRDHHLSYVAPYRPNQNFHRPREQYKDNRVILTLDSLVSTLKEILATEHQFHLPQPPPLMGAPSKENLNKY
nr:reverse transcriptase domain-containing protein [Tanacetum cinerariifolium]